MTAAVYTIRLGFDQCYVVRGDGVIVIDAGQPGKAADFARELAGAGIDAKDVRLIVLTHGHWDHIGSAMEIRELSGAPLAMHRAEAVAVREAPIPLSPGGDTLGQDTECPAAAGSTARAGWEYDATARKTKPATCNTNEWAKSGIRVVQASH
jgi:glyoxylase-like metal-dependent hydrolase (beta-lactamase superfamily II)